MPSSRLGPTGEDNRLEGPPSFDWVSAYYGIAERRQYVAVPWSVVGSDYLCAWRTVDYSGGGSAISPPAMVESC
mgnify:CR=1 FL=1